MNSKLNNTLIPEDSEPKFLGIKFDRRLNFGAQVENIKKKASDRLNILKVLKYNKQWKLDESLLIKIYKSLIRSVLDYSSFLIGSISPSYLKSIESIQNQALRIIFDKKWDEMSSEDLRKKAKVKSIAERSNMLMERYINKAIESNNELTMRLIENYLAFKNRKKRNPNQATNQIERDLIIENNFRIAGEKETIETLLSSISRIAYLRSDAYPP